MGARDERRLRTREAIGDAALALFLEKGYDETTFDDVAERAGVSRSTVFRYFPEKEELVFARDLHHLGALQGLLRAAEDLEDIEALHDVMLDFGRLLERDETLLARARLVAGNPRLFARGVAIRTAWEAIVARDLAGGRSPSLQERVRAATVMGAVFSAVGEWQARGGRLTPLIRRALGYTLAAN